MRPVSGFPGRAGWRGATAFVCLLAGVVALECVTAPRVSAAGSGPITLPDLRIFVPTHLISIGGDPSTGDRQLRFTHITADVGAGPFEIDPHYNQQTGVSTFVQAIYRTPSPGDWVLDHTVPIAATGKWHPPSDYHFPLTSFTLRRVNSDGSTGAVVATSPKTDYCITGDTELGGTPDTPVVPGTPDQTHPPQSNCNDPTKPLGWSVGWGDEYDQTDAGQPIDLRGVADGKYVLRGIVDPLHVFTERSLANNVTDTTLLIEGTSVTVLSQFTHGVPIPTVALTSPRGGAAVSGTVTVRATASASAPDVVRSVQFLLDGRPLGRAVTAAPFSYVWTVDGTAPGGHWLSAEVADSEGNMATAPPVGVTVERPPPITVSLVRWRGGVLRLRLNGVPRGATVRARVAFARKPTRTYYVNGGHLRARTPDPRTIALTMLIAGRQEGATIVLHLDQRPIVHIANPSRGETVSGVVPVSADATGGTPIAFVQFTLDGRPLGRRINAQPYAIEWDTQRVRHGRHVLGARVTDVAGHSSRTRLRVVVRNPPPRMTCFVLQAHANARGEGTVTTRAIDVLFAGETLLALVSADGPPTPTGQRATISGGGLRWRLARRANASYGDSEIWVATASRALKGIRITSGLIKPGYDESLSVVAMEGADGVGATARASGVSGFPEETLRTRSSTSLVFAAGNDWSQAKARSLPTGWVMLDQWLNSATGDTFWSQYTNQPTGALRSVVHVRADGPVGDNWNLAAVELVGGD
jgi:hypothetical protein